MYCQTLVSPGCGATVQTFFLRRVLMTEDFPTEGYPMSPQEICLRSEWREENWRKRAMREPLPKELLMLAWKAEDELALYQVVIREWSAYQVSEIPCLNVAPKQPVKRSVL